MPSSDSEKVLCIVEHVNSVFILRGLQQTLWHFTHSSRYSWRFPFTFVTIRFTFVTIRHTENCTCRWTNGRHDALKIVQSSIFHVVVYKWPLCDELLACQVLPRVKSLCCVHNPECIHQWYTAKDHFERKQWGIVLRCNHSIFFPLKENYVYTVFIGQLMQVTEAL